MQTFQVREEGIRAFAEPFRKSFDVYRNSISELESSSQSFQFLNIY